MFDLDMINRAEYDGAKAAGITAKLHRTPSELEAPYVAEMARAEAIKRFGLDAYTEGYTITTTIEGHLQEAANQALRGAMQAYDKRHGYRGATANIPIDEITENETLFTFLKEQTEGAGLLRALVTAIDEQSIDLLTDQGETLTLEWKALEWAGEYINHDVKGPTPKKAEEIVSIGDLVYLYYETPDEGEPYWRLAQIPEVAGAMVAIAPNNGAIKSLVGGYDFYQSKFNRVIQAKRQPGSGFKPFIYSAALEAGFTPASIFNDAPVVFEDDTMEAEWRPENYSGKFFGPTRLRYALTHSRNLVSIRLLRKLGINFAVQYASRFGFDTSELPRDLSLALGSGAVSPLQMGTGFSVLANGGYYVSPYIIDSIRDNHGEVLYQANPTQVCDEQMLAQLAEAETQPANTPSNTDPAENNSAEAEMEKAEELLPICAKRAISEQNQYLMHSMLRDVIQQGTARKARVLGRRDIAGKTGTTNDQRDAWFNGFNHHMVTVAWLGFDNVEPLGRGEVGGRAALPAWIDFMQVALNGIEEKVPDLPPDMITMRIDVDTGEPVGAGSANAIFEVFETKNAPTPVDSRNPSGRGSTVSTGTVAPAEDPF
jgi:penicillin-binding protein 1A